MKDWARYGRAALGATVLLVSTVIVVGTGSRVGAAATTCGTGGTPAVLALADPNFYIDSGSTPRLDSTYIGYTVRAGSSSETGARLVLSGFTGGVVSLAPGQGNGTMLPNIPAGTAATAYFLLAASGPTTTPQTHTVTLYRGATVVCERTFTYTTVSETIKALANKVTSVTSTAPAGAASIGDLVSVVVQGKTGQLGAGPSFDPGVLSYAPTALSGFPAASWRLERTQMVISPDGVAAPATYTDRLYLSGASGPDRPYTATYWFRAIAPAATTASVQPVQYIASGTQVKHTDLGGSAAGLLPVVQSTANLSLTKQSNVTQFLPVGAVTTGGTVTYTITLTNAGATTGSLDSVVDTLPATGTFVVDSATIAGRAVTPTLVGSTLTFYGPILVGPSSTTTITYQVTLPNVAGTYVNSAVAYFASTQIDGSRDVTTSDPVSASVVVRPATAPVDAVDDVASTNANTAITIAVTGNDSGSGLTVSIVTQPGNGTASVSGTSIVYTPTTGFGGRDSFTYRITDGFTSDVATVTVAVPQARNDSYAKQASANNSPQTLSVTAANGVLSNDFCSTATCTVTSWTNPASGTLTMQNTGAFTYVTPTTATTVTFNYTLTDSNGKTASATVTIYVSDFGPDRGVTPYNTAITMDVTLNDNCTGTCNPTVSTAPAHGSTSVSGNNITYTPTTGFWGIDTYRYSKGGSGTTALVTILVGPPAASLSTPFETPVSRTLTSLTYVAGVTAVSCTGCTYSIGTAPTKGAVALNSNNGAYTYTPAAGTAGTDTFTITTTEPGGMSITATVTVVVGPDAVNDSATVFASSPGNTRTVNINVTTNDACPGTCTVTVTSAPASGTLTQTGSTGAFTYSNGTAIGDVTFRYSIVSSLAPSASSTATVTIRVEGAEADQVVTAYDTPITIDVRSNDYCADCTLGTIGIPTVGDATVSTGSKVLYTPPTGFAGVATFEYAVVKGGNSTTATVTVTVKPSAVDDTSSVVLNTTTPLSLLDNDVCANCVITSITTPSAGSAVIGSTGLIVRYTAPVAGAGPFTFDYTITDSTGQADTATVTLYVATAPTVQDDAVTTPAGQSIGIDADGNDTCPLGFTPCTVDVGSDPLHGVVSLSVASPADLQYTPSAGFTGTDTFTYTNTAANGLASTATVTVTVTPTAADDHAVAGTNQSIVIPVLDNDVCLGCTPTVVAGPTGGSVTATGTSGITYLAPATPGTYTLTYRLTETDTNPTSTVDALVTIVVSDAAPDAVATPHDTAVTKDVIANDSCRTLTPACGVTAIDAAPTHGSAVVVDAGTRDTSVTYNPTTGFVGLDTFTYTASNGTVTATGTVTVLVGPAPLTATVEKNTTATGNVLTGASCSGCTVSIVSYDGTGGDIILDSDGSWTFTPLTDWLGTDEPITYRITDPASGLTRDGTLTITVRSTTPSVTVTKVAGGITDTDDPANGPDAGDTVAYTYTVANTGGSALTAVTLTDDRIAASGIHCDDGVNTDNVIASLAIGAEVTCTATGVIAQADVDAGSLTNTASVAATGPSGGAGAVTDTDQATVTITRSSSMTLAKAAGSITDTDEPANGPGAGDTVAYTYTITNTGNTTLTGLTLADDKIATAALSCPGGTNVVTSLAPAAQATCTATYTLTQADVDAGGVTNHATLEASGPDAGTAPTDATAEATAAITRTATVAVTKVGELVDDVVAPAGRADAGDRVDYTYTVTNTGNTTLTTVALTDDKIAAADISCGTGGNTTATLDPGAYVTCTASTVLTQADVDLGSVTNTATATFTDPVDATGTASTEPVEVPLTRLAALSLEKVAGTITDTTPDNGPDAGDVQPYTLTITNTGNVTLTAITPTDAGLDEGTLVCTGGAATVASLAPGDSVDCTGDHTLTQAEIDSGSVTNAATVDGTAPSGATDPTQATATVETALTRTTSLTLDKTAGELTDTDVPANGAGDVGDTISYSYVVTNTGNTTLHSLSVADDRIAELDCGASPIGDVAPGATVTCTGVDTLTQADVNAGSVTNHATADAYGPEGTTAPSQATDTVTAPVAPSPALSLVKAAGDIVDTDVPADGAGDAGDTVDYTYTITNTGNVTLTDVTLTDDKIADADLSCDAGTNVVARLDPGAQVTCTATYALTQADVDAGGVTNHATAAATAPEGAAAPTDATGDATVTIARTPTLTLAKTGSLHDDVVLPAGVADVGDTIVYTYTITNTGNVTLTDVTLTDDKIAAADLSCDAGTNVLATLSPGGSVTCTATAVLTQADIDSGTVTNVATAAFTDPSDTTDSVTTDPVDVTVERSASLTVAKSAGEVVDTDTPANGTADAGDTVDYTYTITNTGNVTLTDVTLTDDKIAAADLSCDAGTNVVATMAPGATVTCTATYVLTQADVDAGGVTNHATASATAPDGATAPTDATDAATVTVTRTATMTLSKAGALDLTVVDPAGSANPGDTVDYTYTITNTGNVTLTDVTLTDDKIAAADLSCDAGTNVVATMAPGATVTCTASHTLTQGDVDAGSVTNVATATFTDPTDTTDSVSTDPVVVDLTPSASLTLVKTAGDVVDTDTPANGTADAGDTIDYTYTITNTGNVTLTDVTLTDDRIAAADLSCEAGDHVVASLAPGAVVTCTGTDALAQADVDAGSVTNVATVTASAPVGVTVPDAATDTVTVDLTPTANPDGIDAVDDHASAPMGAIVTVDVLANDTGNGISVDFVGRPNTGAVSLDGDTVVVTPPLMYIGDVTFRYGITDGLQTDEAVVTITMTENLEPIVPEVFIDADGDGVRDHAEPGIGGIPMTMSLTARGQVTVHDGQTGSVVSTRATTAATSVRWLRALQAEAAPALFECATSATGLCRVDQLPVGTFRVTAGLDLAAWGMQLSADPDGDGDLGADALSGGTDPAVSFGIHGSSELQGVVFIDHDGDGTYDPTVDQSLGDQPVELVWAGPDGQLGTADDVVVVATTAPDGSYDVTGLPGGTYQVRVPAGSLGDGLQGPAPTTVTVPIGGVEVADVHVVADTTTTTPGSTTTTSGNLPGTGSDTGSALQAAAWLLGLGLLTLLAARRRVPR